MVGLGTRATLFSLCVSFSFPRKGVILTSVVFNLFFSDFDMSDAQQEHALAVERLTPTLAALRMELCPGYMSESCFWKIYFVLLRPRLSKEDAEILSTPQVSCFVAT